MLGCILYPVRHYKRFPVLPGKHGVGLVISHNSHTCGIKLDGPSQPVGDIAQMDQGTGIEAFLNIAFQKGYWAAFGAFLAGLPLYPFFTPKFGNRDAYTWFTEVLSTFRMKLYYRQPEPCKHCSLRKICTGLPADYVKRFNKTELIPYDLGAIIGDPLYFCGDKRGNFKSLRKDG